VRLPPKVRFALARRKVWLRFALGALLLTPAGVAHATAGPAAPVSTASSRWEFVEPHMGTLFQIVVFAPTVGPAKAAARAAFDRIAQLNGIMSDYDPRSELMRLCAQPSGKPVRVSEDLLRILQRSQQLAEETGGAFDVTLGPVIRLWREARRTRQLPSPAARTAALASVGFKKLRIDAARSAVTLLAPGMQLDLGGIAKGYAADAALAVIARHGFPSAMVAASGDLALGNPPPGESGWRVELPADPSTPGQPCVVLAANAGISTSGDAEQFLELGGVRYSHIVDPATGVGLTRSVTVTVVAREATASDGLATACSVLPPERLQRLAEKSAEPIRVIVQTRDARGLAQRHFLGANPPGVSFPL
jgi:thiamine biosynthesis lipoprotein